MNKHSTVAAVYTGSFDPISLGHLNVIERSSKLVDRLVVGIGTNIDKAPMFLPEERVELVTRVTRHLPNVTVKTFDGEAVTPAGVNLEFKTPERGRSRLATDLQQLALLAIITCHSRESGNPLCLETPNGFPLSRE